MIRSFKSRALRRYASTGDASRLSVRNAGRVAIVLRALDRAKTPQDMDLPGLRFHALTGNRKDVYAVRITGNWRMTFEWQDEGAINVDLEDYH